MDDTDSNDGSIGTSGENAGDLKRELDRHIDNFAIDFEKIIRMLQDMIIDARNKTLDASVGDFTNEGDGPFSENGVNPSDSFPETPPLPGALPLPGTHPLPGALPLPSAPLPGALPTVSPSGTNVTPQPTPQPTPEPTPEPPPELTSKPTPEPPLEPFGSALSANPHGPPFILVPDEINIPPTPKPFTITMKQLEDRLKNLKKDDIPVSPSETAEKLKLVYDISGLLAQHINIIDTIPNKTPQLKYAYNLFLNMLTNSLTNINTTHNQKVGHLNIIIPRTPDMGLINIRLKGVNIDNLKYLKGYVDEFNETTTIDEQTKTLIYIYDNSQKIPIFYKLNGKDTLPPPVIIQPQSEINVNNTSDTDEISGLKQQLLGIINANISQLQQLSSELLTKNMELREKMAEYSETHDNEINDNTITQVFNQAVAISNSLIQYNGMVIQEIDGENRFKQRINEQNITTDFLNESIKNLNEIVGKFILTITPAIHDAKQIIERLNLAKTPSPSPPTSPSLHNSQYSSTNSLRYSTTSSVGDSSLLGSFDDSSLLGLKFVTQSEYNGEIQRISKQIEKLQYEVTNPSFGSNIFEVLDNILNLLSEISSNETTLLTTEPNKKYMNNILIELSSIVKLIEFCKLSNKPGYCDTINTIPLNIPNTSIDDVTSEFVDTNLPEIYTYVTQILNNIVSNVKKEAQSYINILEKLSSNGVSDDITNQINEVLGKIITFMRGGIIQDIKEVDGNVLPNTEFTNIIGKIATLLNSVLNYRNEPSHKSDVNDIQFYLLKTVSNMLNCMFINDDNKTNCAIQTSLTKEGSLQNEINNVNEIIKKYNVSNIKVDDISTIRDELTNLFPGVTVPTLQNGPPFTFDSNEYDESPIHDESLDNLPVGNVNTSSSQLSDLSQSSQSVSIYDTIPSKMSNISDQSINNSQMSNLTNIENSTNTPENPLGLHDSFSTIESRTSTDTAADKINGKETTQEDFDIDNANINNNLKQSIGDTINKFTELNNKLNSKNNTTANNGYIFMNSEETYSTVNATSTTSQIINKVTKNNDNFVKLLKLLQQSLNNVSSINEASIINILGKINALISTTIDRFNYTEYNGELVKLYNELRTLMTKEIRISISTSEYPANLTGGGINDKIRFTYKNKRGTKRAKKSRPTRRRKYTPHKKNYYY